MGAVAPKDERPIFFFDIDNCLYPRSRRVHDHMGQLINKYFVTHLSVSTDEAQMLHEKYYKDYGLAIEGLARFHKIDPLDFNREVDDALPLDDILFPDPDLRSLLERFDQSKVKLWLFTNAHITHGKRVVKLLDVEDCFEGITYCDYAVQPLVPKPLPEMFEKAEREAGASDPDRCFFVDDSYVNCVGAHERGWHTVHLVEPEIQAPQQKAAEHQISSLRQLLSLFPQFFKPATNAAD